jgi:hypothetical protein
MPLKTERPPIITSANISWHQLVNSNVAGRPVTDYRWVTDYGMQLQVSPVLSKVRRMVMERCDGAV